MPLVIRTPNKAAYAAAFMPRPPTLEEAMAAIPGLLAFDATTYEAGLAAWDAAIGDGSLEWIGVAPSKVAQGHFDSVAFTSASKAWVRGASDYLSVSSFAVFERFFYPTSAATTHRFWCAGPGSGAGADSIQVQLQPLNVPPRWRGLSYIPLGADTAILELSAAPFEQWITAGYIKQGSNGGLLRLNGVSNSFGVNGRAYAATRLGIGDTVGATSAVRRMRRLVVVNGTALTVEQIATIETWLGL
ncbi:hypothetical protein [Paracoccus litorisediminis]|uniref:Uncharacterized protein n=1 Tax=Paracoccus litorisediminis TaxID=2006130 RepID=A0A844HST3_9RHOB|nr:hypothetical protein [Paracoccus litorisediminis]MTH60661.1 hypothetical protein [Paracoccus litorisediminis]